MSAERDELQKVIYGYFGPTLKINSYKTPEQQDSELAGAILAAGYRKPRTITTAEDLDALPTGTVVLSDAYRYMVHGGGDCGWSISFQRWDDGDWHRGGRSANTHPDNFLPVTVLHEPEA